MTERYREPKWVAVMVYKPRRYPDKTIQDPLLGNYTPYIAYFRIQPVEPEISTAVKVAKGHHPASEPDVEPLPIEEELRLPINRLGYNLPVKFAKMLGARVIEDKYHARLRRIRKRVPVPVIVFDNEHDAYRHISYSLILTTRMYNTTLMEKYMRVLYYTNTAFLTPFVHTAISVYKDYRGSLEARIYLYRLGKALKTLYEVDARRA